MIKNLWINLPVQNIQASLKFYTEIGFKINDHYKISEISASLFVGDNNIVIMLFQEEAFKNITNREIGTFSNLTNVLFSIDSESIDAVNKLASIVSNSGGHIIQKPSGDNNMYGFSFTDINGHSWNVLYMNN